jgi:hypothetical protein
VVDRSAWALVLDVEASATVPGDEPSPAVVGGYVAGTADGRVNRAAAGVGSLFIAVLKSYEQPGKVPAISPTAPVNRSCSHCY